MIIKAWRRNNLDPRESPYPTGTLIQVRDDLMMIETKPNQSSLERYHVSLEDMDVWVKKYGHHWREVPCDPDMEMDIGL